VLDPRVLVLETLLFNGLSFSDF